MATKVDDSKTDESIDHKSSKGNLEASFENTQSVSNTVESEFETPSQ